MEPAATLPIEACQTAAMLPATTPGGLNATAPTNSGYKSKHGTYKQLIK